MNFFILLYAACVVSLKVCIPLPAFPEKFETKAKCEAAAKEHADAAGQVFLAMIETYNKQNPAAPITLKPDDVIEIKALCDTHKTNTVDI
jgi:hypothetical protein